MGLVVHVSHGSAERMYALRQGRPLVRQRRRSRLRALSVRCRRDPLGTGLRRRRVMQFMFSASLKPFTSTTPPPDRRSSLAARNSGMLGGTIRRCADRSRVQSASAKIVRALVAVPPAPRRLVAAQRGGLSIDREARRRSHRFHFESNRNCVVIGYSREVAMPAWGRRYGKRNRSCLTRT